MTGTSIFLIEKLRRIHTSVGFLIFAKMHHHVDAVSCGFLPAAAPRSLPTRRVRGTDASVVVTHCYTLMQVFHVVPVCSIVLLLVFFWANLLKNCRVLSGFWEGKKTTTVKSQHPYLTALASLLLSPLVFQTAPWPVNSLMTF